jgi:hypothetical protein
VGQVGMASKESCLPPPGGAAAQYQAGLETLLEDLYAPEAVKAVVLCQAGLMRASESCLRPQEVLRLERTQRLTWVRWGWPQRSRACRPQEVLLLNIRPG